MATRQARQVFHRVAGPVVFARHGDWKVGAFQGAGWVEAVAVADFPLAPGKPREVCEERLQLLPEHWDPAKLSPRDVLHVRCWRERRSKWYRFSGFGRPACHCYASQLGGFPARGVKTPVGQNIEAAATEWHRAWVTDRAEMVGTVLDAEVAKACAFGVKKMIPAIEVEPVAQRASQFRVRCGPGQSQSLVQVDEDAGSVFAQPSGTWRPTGLSIDKGCGVCDVAVAAAAMAAKNGLGAPKPLHAVLGGPPKLSSRRALATAAAIAGLERYRTDFRAEHKVEGDVGECKAEVLPGSGAADRPIWGWKLAPVPNNEMVLFRLVCRLERILVVVQHVSGPPRTYQFAGSLPGPGVALEADSQSTFKAVLEKPTSMVKTITVKTKAAKSPRKSPSTKRSALLDLSARIVRRRHRRRSERGERGERGEGYVMVDDGPSPQASGPCTDSASPNGAKAQLLDRVREDGLPLTHNPLSVGARYHDCYKEDGQPSLDPADDPAWADTLAGRVRNQNSCGTCWAFGAAKVFSDRKCIARLRAASAADPAAARATTPTRSTAAGYVEYSPLSLMACSGWRGCFTAGGTTMGGGGALAAFATLQTTGIATEQCFPTKYFLPGTTRTNTDTGQLDWDEEHEQPLMFVAPPCPRIGDPCPGRGQGQDQDTEGKTVGASKEVKAAAPARGPAAEAERYRVEGNGAEEVIKVVGGVPALRLALWHTGPVLASISWDGTSAFGKEMSAYGKPAWKVEHPLCSDIDAAATKRECWLKGQGTIRGFKKHVGPTLKKRPVDHSAGHAVAIVGWHCETVDSRCGTGAFLLQNSWGREWGFGGYAWASFDALGILDLYSGEAAIAKILGFPEHGNHIIDVDGTYSGMSDAELCGLGLKHRRTGLHAPASSLSIRHLSSAFRFRRSRHVYLPAAEVFVKSSASKTRASFTRDSDPSRPGDTWDSEDDVFRRPAWAIKFRTSMEAACEARVLNSDGKVRRCTKQTPSGCFQTHTLLTAADWSVTTPAEHRTRPREDTEELEIRRRDHSFTKCDADGWCKASLEGSDSNAYGGSEKPRSRPARGREGTADLGAFELEDDEESDDSSAPWLFVVQGACVHGVGSLGTFEYNDREYMDKAPCLNKGDAEDGMDAPQRVEIRCRPKNGAETHVAVHVQASRPSYDDASKVCPEERIMLAGHSFQLSFEGRRRTQDLVTAWSLNTIVNSGLNAQRRSGPFACLLPKSEKVEQVTPRAGDEEGGKVDDDDRAVVPSARLGPGTGATGGPGA